MTQAAHTESSRTESLPVLWQFRMSHYNEKARWALDFKRIPHVRRTLVPGLHMVRLLRLSGQKQTPVLVLGGQVIVGSGEIIQALERAYPTPALLPAEASERQRALELARILDDELGPVLRVVLFHEILPDSALCTALFAQGWGAPGRAFYRLAFPGVRVLMRRDMRIDAGTAQDAVEKTLVALSRLDNLIRPASYLVGDAFSVADLTAAALLSPVARPPEFPYPMPQSDVVDRVRERLGHQRVFDWCRFVYARHRGRSAEVTLSKGAEPGHA